MKNLKSYNAFNEELTYNQSLEIGDSENIIKKYIENNYPEYYYTNKNNILGRYGRNLSNSSISKITRLARQKKDSELSKLLDDFFIILHKYKQDHRGI